MELPISSNPTALNASLRAEVRPKDSILLRHAVGRIPAFGVAALLLLTSAYISVSRFQFGQNADSIVPILVSLQHWTPYFWETNRYGMLLPLLAMPLHNPLVNLIVQTGLGILAGMGCSFLLVSYFFEDSTYWWTAAVLQNIWLLLLVPRFTQFDWFVVQCYGTSLSLAFASLLLVRKRKMGLALLLMLLSEWVNFAGFVFLFPLILQRHWIDREKKGLLPSLAILTSATAFGYWLMRKAAFQTTASGFAPVSTWVEGWRQLVHVTLGGSIQPPVLWWWVLAPAACGLAVTVFLPNRKRVLLVCLMFIITAAAYWLFTGTLLWVRENLYGMRYVYPSVLLLALVGSILTVAPLQRKLSDSHLPPIAATALLFLAAVTVFGRPSISLVRHHLEERFGGMTADILNSHANAVTGDYWKVWPAIFESNLALYERGEHREVYGLTYRGTGTADLWMQQPGICVDALPQDKDASVYMSNTGRHFQLIRNFGTLSLYCEH